MARAKTVAGDAREVARATRLIKLGARLQLLEAEVHLSRERLLKLYKEIHRKSPPKGMLPFSTEWFMTWQPNVHSSIFMNIYEYLNKSTALEQVDAIAAAYELYREQLQATGLPEVLSITRAWRLVKFTDAGMLTLRPCTCCGGKFVMHALDLHKDFVCGLCEMPARAGKTARAAAEQAGEARAAA